MTRRWLLTLVLSCGSLVSVAAVVGGEQEKSAAADERAGRVGAGDYVEQDEQGRPNPLFTLRAREVTANILELRGANGWVAYLSYDESAREYRGFFEWQQFGPYRSPGGKWADLYQVRLVRQDGGRFVMTGKSKSNDLTIRAAPAPEPGK
jgi:hypothetical protein